MPKELYFEDFYVGQKFDSIGSYKVTAAEIKEFGQKYDPQPFHLDEAAGEGSFFKGLAASGWLTAAIVMRLRVQSITVAGGMIGAGVEEMRWTTPVRPERHPALRDRGAGRAPLAVAHGLRHRAHTLDRLQPAQRGRDARHGQLPRARPPHGLGRGRALRACAS
jgi:hypothetical protein